VVTRGTATRLKNPNYTLAAKTGTALVADGKKGYRTKIYRASICGYFPANNPQYTCMVMVNAPSKGNYYGGSVAGPVLKEIADKVYANSHNLHGDIKLVLNDSNPTKPSVRFAFKQSVQTVLNGLGYSVPNNTNQEESGSEWVSVVKTSTQNNISINSKKIYRNLVPDVIGMGLKDALYLLENNGLKVETIGYGKVKEQSLPVGTTIVKGNKITLRLG
jgi:cell division protein FtsI (penicillin-binding protein 3)